MDKETFLIRNKIISTIRDFFSEKGFLEVETPILTLYPDVEPTIDSFEVLIPLLNKGEEGEIQTEQYKKIGYLHTSPEYYMKRLLVDGFDKIYQITKFFRYGETSNLHNPEFTGLEWYQINTDYNYLMNFVEELFIYIANKIFKTTIIEYKDKKIDLSIPWARITVRDAFIKCTDVDLNLCRDEKEFYKVLKDKGFSNVSIDDRWDDMFHLLYVRDVEPYIGRDKPTFLYDYPAPLSSLAKLKSPTLSHLNKGETREGMPVAERVEFFIAGLELGNGFSELTDPVEQKKRFIKSQEIRKKIGKPVYPYDEDFVKALENGMPESAGMAVGVDRIVMLFTNKDNIQDVLFFPWNNIL